MADETSIADSRPRPIDPRLVFRKTAAGAAAIQQRPAGLSPGARRILIVIDGQRSLAHLPPFVRPGELGSVIDELVDAGLITLDGFAPPVARVDDAVLEQRERELLGSIKRALAGAFEAELGDAGHVLEARVQDSVSVEVLRRVVRDGIDAVAARRGEEAARRVVALVRPLAETRAPQR